MEFTLIFFGSVMFVTAIVIPDADEVVAAILRR
jgi:hypothetical protein